ncbi:MAG: FtsH protease activity modulator HflK [Sphingomonadales bacterium]
MPWQSNNGGGQNPWDQRPGGRGPQPPNLDELIKQGKDQLKGVLPGGRPGMILGLIAIAMLWAATGIYRVQPDEQGVVLRFGEWITTTQPGLHYHLPVPIETVIIPKVTRENKVEVGFRSGADVGRAAAQRDVSEESLMLTGDENIVDIDFVVNWVIKDAGQFLFNIQDPPTTLKVVAESAMREVIGKTEIQSALTEGRQQVEQSTAALIQKTLDDYKSGILITRVKMQKVDPPAQVIDKFRDVQAARADMERQRNEGETYANDIIPRARGEAERMLQQAEAYKQQVIARSQGEAARFLSVYNQYKVAKDVTKKRIYLETMEKIMGGMNKIIIDQEGGSGVVPYLPLPELQKRRQEGAQQ